MTSKKNAICLIRPPATEMIRFTTGSIVPPLGLAYIVAALEEDGQPVCAIDAVGEGPGIRTRYFRGYCVGLRLPQIVSRVPEDVAAIGITVTFTHEWPLVVHLTELLRERFPEIPIVMGGEHVTAMPEFCLFTSMADYVVMGEGEETSITLFRALRDDRSTEKIQGISFRKGSDVMVNRRRSRQKVIDDIPEPAWHHFNLETYHVHGFIGGMLTVGLSIPVLATRGCPYQCTFCASPNMWTTRWVARNPKLVVDEIEGYVRRYGARSFPFHDLTAIINRSWIITFCNELIERKLDISWQLPTGTRSEVIDREVSLLLERSGMTSTSYAPESGSDYTRKLIKKKIKREHLFESIDASVAAGLNVSIFMVVGFPHETPELISENLEFIDRLVAHGVADMSVSFFIALPGTEMFDSLSDGGRLRFNKAYFDHVLGQVAFMPSVSHTPYLSPLKLAFWKFRMLWRFYSRSLKRNMLHKDRFSAFSLLIEGAASKNHEAKVQTALRNGIKRTREFLTSFTEPRWISRREEKKLFLGWDEIYSEIRRQKIEEGIADLAPEDSAELHKRNTIRVYAADHSTSRIMSLPKNTANRYLQSEA